MNSTALNDQNTAIDDLLTAWNEQQRLRSAHAPLADRVETLQRVSDARRRVQQLRRAA